MRRQALRRRLRFWLVEHVGPALLCLWFATIRMRWHGGEYAVPSPVGRRSVIFVFWHQRLLCFLYTHRSLGGRVLVSRSSDGEIVARLLAGLGFSPVRGSTRRGGAEAVRELLAVAGDGRDVGITPDGPRGPQHVFKAGAVYLASRSGLPIVPLCVSYRGFWTLPSWDGFHLPHPFTQAVVRAGAPIHVPPGLDADGVDAWRQDLEAMLSGFTAETDRRRADLYRAGRRRPDGHSS
jgi:lysophospholipid acyltransferase (LPLAT)-like uncharacterized protein